MKSKHYPFTILCQVLGRGYRIYGIYRIWEACARVNFSSFDQKWKSLNFTPFYKYLHLIFFFQCIKLQLYKYGQHQRCQTSEKCLYVEMFASYSNKLVGISDSRITQAQMNILHIGQSLLQQKSPYSECQSIFSPLI